MVTERSAGRSGQLTPSCLFGQRWCRVAATCLASTSLGLAHAERCPSVEERGTIATTSTSSTLAECNRPQREHVLLQNRHLGRRSASSSSGFASSCPYDRPYDRELNAGCFVVRDNKVLAVELHTGKFNLPGGSLRRGEAPACTAWRETLEETGYFVEPQDMLRRLHDNYELWHCSIVDPDARPRNDIDFGEVRQAIWLSAEEVASVPWRFPDQRSLYLSLLSDFGEEPAPPSAVLPRRLPGSCPYHGWQHPSSAACFVVNGSKALFVEEWTGRLNVPGGGSQNWEAPQCTAWRRTWQETGYLATPGDILTTFGSFPVFQCSLDAQVHSWAEGGEDFDATVRGVVWFGADELAEQAWRFRFPDQVSEYRRLLTRVSD
eukprot:TRINITY_DN85917_c0_g1_i1.p1 TRINITY_DN85917_c0_g1~~TRINITY_DN85917_c0_g1_i1.p1  ORF type:complete len:377 (+),score=56.64 TRINITY_DN85917_c0_g1_i1:94-1224(+)